jgi:hypothetical protein
MLAAETPVLQSKKSQTFHKQFHPDDEKNKTLPILFRTSSFAVKAMAQKKSVKDWTFAYDVTVKTARQLLCSVAELDHPPVNTMQKLASTPLPVPKGLVKIKDEFPIDQSVAAYFKENSPGEWPIHVDDKDTRIHGEWLIPGGRESDKVLYYLHGGIYVFVYLLLDYGLCCCVSATPGKVDKRYRL